MGVNNSYGEDKGTTKLILTTLGLTGNDTNETKNGYIYYYHLLDSSKFSFCTINSFSMGSIAEGLFGSGVKATAEEHNAIRFCTTGGDAISSGTISLYGLKAYS
jgi:hypothetical protein